MLSTRPTAKLAITWFILAYCSAPIISAERPNIILFIADDVSWNDYGCYGNEHARTPNIDKLATGGVRFDQAFLTASSCSPSRASIVTGRYPHNNGKAAELHLPIAANLPWFPELLRESGYFTALSGKNHMKVDDKLGAGDQPRAKAFDLIDGGRTKGNSGGHANWLKITKERPKDKPFFFWFAAYDAHRGWDADRQWREKQYGAKHSGNKVRVPPFLVPNTDTKDDLASYYNEVSRFDHYIGKVVEELVRQGALDNTLIFVLADNGRPFPRAKTRLHDSGMKTALVAHWPNGIKDPGASNSLVSIIDLAPTILAAAEVSRPSTFQGVGLQPVFQDRSALVRRFAFSEHNWHDYEAHGRSVRDGSFLYIKNNRPYQPLQGPADSVRSPSHLSLLAQKDADSLTAAQADVFAAPRTAEELYLIDRDPHQLNNLAKDSKYASELARLRKILDQWSEETADSVPAKLSSDSFDRVTGKSIDKSQGFRGVTPGEDRQAWKVNASGPR
ncbi:MAG: sulfatase [Planctomycetota bacterium]|nr:sulfatase [Planctomycetota bacterium]